MLGQVPAAIQWPMWTLVIGVLLALLITIVAIVQLTNVIRDQATKDKGKHDPIGFAELLKRGIDTNTKLLGGEFADQLRRPPADIGQLRAAARELRRMVQQPLQFVEHMRRFDYGRWPSDDILDKFNDWAAVVSAVARMIDDMFEELGRAKEDCHTGHLLDDFRNDRWYIQRDLTDLDKRAGALGKAVGKFKEEKEKEKKGDGRSRHRDEIETIAGPPGPPGPPGPWGPPGPTLTPCPSPPSPPASTIVYGAPITTTPGTLAFIPAPPVACKHCPPGATQCAHCTPPQLAHGCSPRH